MSTAIKGKSFQPDVPKTGKRNKGSRSQVVNENETRENSDPKTASDSKVNVENSELSKEIDDLERELGDNFDELVTDFKPDEYLQDSSDEEDVVNTIGNVPLEWYRDFDHLGYDIDAEKILRPERFNEIDNFLAKHDDPNYWRTVTDPRTGRKHVLTSEEIGLINSIMTKMYPTKGSRDLPPKVVDPEVRQMPVNNVPPSKEMFNPLTKYEEFQIRKIRQRLAKFGFIRKEKPKVDDEFNFYDIWSAGSKLKHHPAAIPAPKMALPTHAESYNPPNEFLLTEDEKNEMLAQDYEDRQINFVPQKFPNLRTVPAYENLLQERFERCLDLYMCPRQRKLKVKVTSDQVLPKLPAPADLRPFPYRLLYSFNKLDSASLTSLEINRNGSLVAAGFTDGSLRIFDAVTTKCLLKIPLSKTNPVASLSWTPSYEVLCACAGHNVFLLVPAVDDHSRYEEASDILKLSEDDLDSSSVLEWRESKNASIRDFVKINIKHKYDVTKCKWHRGSDYFLTICPSGGKKESIYFHRLSKRTTQLPFGNLKGELRDAEFHLTDAALWVVSNLDIKLYDLVNQSLKKKLKLATSETIIGFSQHFSGENFLIAGSDYSLNWFDSALMTTTFQTMSYHSSKVTCMAFHQSLPLFASGGQNGLIVVAHSTVTDQTDAVIVPLKQIQVQENSIASLKFHPKQPWLFVGLSNGNINLYIH